MGAFAFCRAPRARPPAPDRGHAGRLRLILAGIFVAEPAAADVLRRFLGSEKSPSLEGEKYAIKSLRFS
jgi:hypothetical protein